MFLTVSKRLKRTGGWSIGAGMRLTKRNAIWFIWVFMFYIIAYYMFWLSAWVLVGIAYVIFVLPFRLITNAIKGGGEKPPATQSVSAPKESMGITTKQPASSVTPILGGAYNIVVPEGSPYEHLTFRVKGVTFDNEDGENRQSILEDIERQRRGFENGNCVVSIEQYEYEGKPAFKIYANDKQIGNAPADLCGYINSNYGRVEGFNYISIIGGEDDLSYGAEVVLCFNRK